MQFLAYLGTGSLSLRGVENPSTALRSNSAVQTPNKAIPHLVGLKQDKTDYLVLLLVLVCPFPPIIAATALPEMELKSGGITPKARKMVSVLGRGEGEGERQELPPAHWSQRLHKARLASAGASPWSRSQAHGSHLMFRHGFIIFWIRPAVCLASLPCMFCR